MTKPINPHTPKQVGSIVGIDRMDSIDRAKLDVKTKLEVMCAECANMYGRDPRTGGFTIVARPRVILQMFRDLRFAKVALQDIFKLQRPFVIGSRDGDADVVAFWHDIPVSVRCTVNDDGLWIVPNHKLPKSHMIDRKQAGQLRLAAINDLLDALLEQSN